MVDQVVECVFLGEEILDQRAALLRRGAAQVVEEADIAAGAKRLVAAAAHDHRLHGVVGAPGQQGVRDGAHHVE